jgi:hypothetical protein
MTVTIHLEDQIAQALQAQAEATGLSLEEFVRRVLSDAAPIGSAASTGAGVADFDQALDNLFTSTPAGVEIASTWSRSDIYNDHD